MAANSPPEPTTSNLPPVPSSPTYSYASTANPLSQYSLPLPPPPRPPHAVLTKADLDQSQAAYSDLLASAKSYRVALASLSTAASAFGAALESCARLKEARAEALVPPAAANNAGGVAPLSNSFTTAGGAACTADTLLTVAGLQHLVANHQHILSETVYRAFEVPLLHELDKWRAAVEDEEEAYARAAAAQSREIRRLEKEGMKLHRQRRRDVAKFRSHLVELTTKLDGLTALHCDHARTLLRESQETSVRIVEASCSLARAEVEIYESLARKGWTGGGLEDVLEKGVDLFAAEMMDPLAAGPGGKGAGAADSGPGDGTKLFSILPPRSILADASGPDTPRGAGGGIGGVGGGHNPLSDSLLEDGDRYQSLSGAVSSSDTATPTGAARERDRDADSAFSEPNRSRNLRPFSPQPKPLRLNPEDLLGGLDLEDGEGPSGSSREEGQPHYRSDEDRDEGCTVHDHQDEDDEEAHPWRNEGLRRESRSDDDDDDEADRQDRVRASLGELEQRDEGWNAADVGT